MNLRQPIFRIIGVLGIVPRGEQGLFDEVSIVVVLIAKVGIEKFLQNYCELI